MHPPLTPGLTLHPLPSRQAPGDTEFSLYDSEEDGPSYWDLEQVSRGAKGGGGEGGGPVSTEGACWLSPPVQSSNLEGGKVSPFF